mmetsp:Transcript_26033/g.36492  ORF Transcript_26033/g.36492 Transcript_26033/m.36492 type:complete len:82 (-) Transcript_26033:55-300(-)
MIKDHDELNSFLANQTAKNQQEVESARERFKPYCLWKTMKQTATVTVVCVVNAKHLLLLLNKIATKEYNSVSCVKIFYYRQ